MPKDLDYTVVYRKGGIENFTWNKTLLRGNRESMQIERTKLEKAGHKALVVKVRDLETGGLPETFD